MTWPGRKRSLAKVKGHPGIISEVRREAKSEPPPLAYDLTELQRDANRRLNFSAQKTLAVLQNLYQEHKLVTYPRTDSRYLTRDIVPTLPARLQGDGGGALCRTGQTPPAVKKSTPGKRFVDDSKVSDHHAIIPTEQPLKIEALSLG